MRSKLTLSQSALSRRIDKLETSLGIKLFERTTRRVTLTLKGHAFAQRSDKLLADFEEVMADLSEVSLARTGLITVACVDPLILIKRLPAQTLFAGYRMVTPTGRHIGIIHQRLEMHIRLRAAGKTDAEVGLTANHRVINVSRTAVDQFDSYAGIGTGLITVACVPSAAYYFMPNIIRLFQARYPRVRVKLIDSSAANVAIGWSRRQAAT